MKPESGFAPSAQPPPTDEPNVRTWEYLIEEAPCGLDGEELDKLGTQGWELIYISPRGTRWVFKRPSNETEK